MQPTFDTFSFLMLTGAAHGFLLGVTLLSIRRGNRMANRILALALIFFALGLALHTLVYSKYILRVPHLAELEPLFISLIGPLFYHYVKALTEKQFRLNRKALLHASPAALCLLAFLPFYLLPATEKIHHLQAEHQQPYGHCLVIRWFFIMQLFAYLVASIRELILHGRRIKESHSSLEKINRRWLQYLFVAFLVTWVVTLGIQMSFATPEAFNYSWLLVAMVIFSIGYLGLRKPEVFSAEGNVEVAGESSARKKYEKSTLTAERADEYLAKLQKLMATAKPFLNKDLTLESLATKLSISSHHLSQIINERLHQNFFNFVNSYRVEEAKKLLRDPANGHINIAELGFSSGFSSVATFNAVFKKFTHTSPSQYQKQSARRDTPAKV